jgi:hypothetical protein
MHIIAYAYEADVHCIDCTIEKYHYSKQSWIDWRFKVSHPASDRNGIHVNQLDRDGNFVHPVYAIDEWGEFGVPTNRTRYGVLIMNQALYCGDCHDVIAEYTVPVTGTDAWQGSLAIYRSNNQIN